MDFKFTPEEEAFRDEVRAFLDANLPADANRNDFAFIAEWSRKVREKRWVGFSWPKEVGGGGGGIVEQVILKEEMAKRHAPPLGTCFMGLAWVGPVDRAVRHRRAEAALHPRHPRRQVPVVHRLLGARRSAAISRRSSARACATATTTW